MRRAIRLVFPLLASTFLMAQWSQEEHLTYSLYDQFFARVDGIAHMTEKARAEGRDPYNLAGKMVQRQLGFTDAEYEKVKAIAAESRGETNANLGKNKADFEAFKAQHPDAAAAGKYPPDLIAGHNQLLHERHQIISDHIAQLKAALGDARFQVLDNYVRTSMRTPQKGAN